MDALITSDCSVLVRHSTNFNRLALPASECVGQLSEMHTLPSAFRIYRWQIISAPLQSARAELNLAISGGGGALASLVPGGRFPL
eukprot:1747419-Amphidinium_carterae.1